MGGMRSRIDSIRYAASFVLAGCAPTNPTTPVDTTRTATPPEPSVLVVVDPGPPNPAPPPRPTATVSGETPQDACQAYRDSIDGTPDDPRQRDVAPPSGPPQEGHGGGQPPLRGWAAGDGKIMCTIIWDQKPVTAMVTHHPTCCPMPGGRSRPCPQPSQRQVKATELLREQVTILDGRPASTVERVVIAPPQMRHNCGRRPQGLAFEAPASTSPGEVLATMAVLEAASVAAFDRLARELEAHGAPPELVARARSAMADEIRHTRTLRRLAKARGGRPIPWRRAELPVRPRLEVGIENAAEGCVSEAFGAAIALVQAERATDPEVRAAFAVIAEEELEHAALAWDVHAWLMNTGGSHERDVFERALRDATKSIDHDDPGRATREALGLPDPATSRALLDQMVEQFGLAA